MIEILVSQPYAYGTTHTQILQPTSEHRIPGELRSSDGHHDSGEEPVITCELPTGDVRSALRQQPAGRLGNPVRTCEARQRNLAVDNRARGDQLMRRDVRPHRLRAVGLTYPGVRFVPTGGVNQSNLCDYLAIPSVVARWGSRLTNQWILGDRAFEEIARLAGEAAEAHRERA